MTVRIGSHLQQAAIGVAARMSRAERLALAADLRRVVVDGEVLSDPADLETFAYDASFLTQLAPVVPDVAVVARTAADVVAVMRHARAHGIPVTPRGAASGAGGGCVALRGGIVLAMNAMDSILEVDVANGQVVVEPGVVHARLNEVLGRPANERPFLLLVVGYPSEDARVPVITKKPLSEIATFAE